MEELKFKKFLTKYDSLLEETMPLGTVAARKEKSRVDDFMLLYNKVRLSEQDIAHLKKLDKEYADVFMLRRLDYVRLVLNKEQEKKKFFEALKRGAKYNPIFEHNPEPYTNGALNKALSLREKFFNFDCYLSGFYVERLNFLISWIQLKMMDPNSQEYIDAVFNLFGKPTPGLITEAEKIILANPYKSVSSDDRSITPTALKKRIEQALEELGYDKWKVVITPDITPRMSVKDYFEVNINSRAKFSEADVIGLIAHEIKGHVGRRWHGWKTGLLLFRDGLVGKNELDEGMAIYNSLQVENPKPNILFNIAFYALMVNQLDKLSFYELFEHGRQYLPNDSKLFDKVLRLKRVCKDTSVMVGDSYEKDYLNGYLRVIKLSDAERQDVLHYNVGPQNFDQVDLIKAFLKINGFVIQKPQAF